MGFAARLLSLVLAGSAVTAWAQVDARMLRYPDVSATDIAFVYAGDIWVVAKAGGVARRLSTPAGEESFPRFSPDGRTLAYVAAYDGNQDVFTVPVAGGIPTRVTHHPAPDRVLDWFPDGAQLLVASSMESGKDRFNQLYRVGRDGGLPVKLPLPYGEFGMVAGDGRTLAYLPIARDFRTWKRYRGGMAPDIWLFDLEARTSRRVTTDPANDSQPMWYGSTLYFLSDRGPAMRANIWAFDQVTGEVRQVTSFEEYDVHFPAVGPSDIVLENGGRLYRLELPAETLHEVEVEVVTDLATLRPRAEKVAVLIRTAAISPSGQRVAFEARGELFSVPKEHGPVLNLTRSSGSAERHPAWSPDGSTLAYLSDASGEYELWTRPADGSGGPRRVTSMGPGYRYRLFWSPDGSRVAFVDQAMRINLCELATGEVTVLDQGLYLMEGALRGFTVSWSPDSRWVAWSRSVGRPTAAVFLYDTASGARHQVTSGFYEVRSPVFDPGGDYLYVLTERSFEPVYSDFDNTWVYPNAAKLAAVPLRDDVPSPLQPRNDVEGAEEGEEDEEGDRDDATGGAKEAVAPVEIDLEGFERRMVELPPKPGNYRDLAAADGRLVYLRAARSGSGEDGAEVLLWDLETREEKTVLAKADGFQVSGDGKKLLVASGGSFAIVDLAPGQTMEKPLRTGDLEATVDPAAEWRQIFADAWRFERDFFYDPGLHGVDWEEMRRRYGALLDWVVTRWDLNYVLGELIAELNASHAYRGGGDEERPPRREVGLLGADFTLEGGAFRIARILDGAPWDSELRSPLARPGVDVREGDWLLAVNGRPLDPDSDPWAAFEGLAGVTVELTVNDRPSPEGARRVLVETLASDYRLRNLAWIEGNRRRVEEASGGRVGYIYVPDTGLEGQKELARQYYGEYGREGLIVDERFNSGGQIPDRFVELLGRRTLGYWGVRDGRDWQWPRVANDGPKAMLINGWSGSGGDCFPYFFRQAGLGPLIGTRTWGGLIGISGSPSLVDGGRLTVPTFSFYDLDGRWAVEGRGVEPDIEVVDDPALMTDGGDPQLERAVAEVMAALDADPPRRPEREPYPDRSGR